MEEGITPVGRNYFDGKLPMKSYPLMTITRFLFWSMFAKIRPFWYIDYNKGF